MQATFTTRAVLRSVDPGSQAICAFCQTPVKFKARRRQAQVIANVYVDSVWDRVEHYHAPCYADAGLPYGAPTS